MNHRHGDRGTEAGRPRRRRQLRWNSDQRCAVAQLGAVGSEPTRRRYAGSRLTWQLLRRRVQTHKTTTELRSVHAVVQPALARGRRGTCKAQPTSAPGERSQASTRTALLQLPQQRRADATSEGFDTRHPHAHTYRCDNSLTALATAAHPAPNSCCTTPHAPAHWRSMRAAGAAAAAAIARTDTARRWRTWC
jgi:hypothetical protein